MGTLKDIDIPDPEKTVQTVNGSINDHDIFMIALSTCQWCKRGKKWLNRNNFQYKYIDIDKLTSEEKHKFKKQVKETFGLDNLKFPFLIVNSKEYCSGLDFGHWRDLLDARHSSK